MPAIAMSTYRMQLHAGFGFADCAEIVPYLRRFGVTHLYISPCLQATHGSTHGYDVTDPARLSSDLGGEEGFNQLCDALRHHDMGLVLDIVPNHMAAVCENPAWMQVLENGPHSEWAHLFDIDWNPTDSALKDKVLLPILGKPLQDTLRNGEISLLRNDAQILAAYYDHRLPLSPESVGALLLDISGVISHERLGRLGAEMESLQESTGDRRESLEAHRERLLRVLDDPAVADALDRWLARVSEDEARLQNLLDRQYYLPVFWREGDRRLNYRRFFDITSLVGLRMEDQRVFLYTHREILHLAEKYPVDGLRVDHPDGLRDPQEYFSRLRQHAPATWLVAEKILEPGENLPADWPVAGTTGYDFLNQVNGLFVQPEAEAPLTALYAEVSGCRDTFAQAAESAKHQFLTRRYTAEIDRLATRFLAGLRENGTTPLPDRHDIVEALTRLIAAFPVYRTYADAAHGRISSRDSDIIREAIADASDGTDSVPNVVWQALEGVLVQEGPANETLNDFVMLFQQTTGPAMAKGVEDTVFYRYNRLLSLNEVGGAPDRFGISPAAFHDLCSRRVNTRPASMLATSTHDTKRDEDVRLRINVLTEMPEKWSASVMEWRELNAGIRSRHDIGDNMELYVYQTLIGACPIETDRLCDHLIKAAREAKEQTSWLEPDASYEEDVRAFAVDIMASQPFVRSLERLLETIVPVARVHSLAQTLIKCTAPGVPDIYRGTELESLNLVDPDNRRPVDFEWRRRLLDELYTASVIPDSSRPALRKLYVAHTSLQLRRRFPETFAARAAYKPVIGTGHRADHLLAYRRGANVVVAVPRLVHILGADWGDTLLPLPPGNWRNLFTDSVLRGEVAVADLFNAFPVALLLKQGK